MRRRVGLGAVVVGVAAIVIGLSTDLRSPPRYDGAGYSVLGLALSTGRGYREIHQPDAPPHAHFPPGYPMVLAGLWSVTGRSVIAAHAFSIACTVAATWLGWRWFRRIEPRRVADRLGLALAINWTWAFVGGSIQSEPLYLLLSMAVLNLACGRGRFNPLWIGLLLGACVLTRHAGVCLVVAVLLDRLSRQRWRDAAIIALTSALVVAPWIVWLATAKRETQAGLLQGEGLVTRVVGQALFYARRLPDVLTGPFVEVATVFGRSRGVAIGATVVAVMVSMVLLIGLICAVGNPRRRLAGLVPLVTLPLLLVWPFTEAGRFLIPILPCLLVGMVEGMSWVRRAADSSTIRIPGGWWVNHLPYEDFGSAVSGSARLLPSRTLPKCGSAEASHYRNTQTKTALKGFDRSLRRFSATILVLIAIPYSAYALVTGRAAAQRKTHDDFDAACAWIAAHPDPPGPVLSRHPAEVYWATGRTSIEPASDDLNILAKQIRERRVAYLLVDPERFANAPPTPLARYAVDRRGTVLVHPGRVAVYEVIPDSGP